MMMYCFVLPHRSAFKKNQFHPNVWYINLFFNRFVETGFSETAEHIFNVYILWCELAFDNVKVFSRKILLS